ncbi:hypothetical protein M422DRAFT_254597 [Sphaerobolus stellatus SS14]|uniref:Uncharacterized protein n=1 Tax=Sphaerobolus stellatus (strain SS14) TaxID=990650 RepID=A0A0C9VV91_SPHS4|nr:hypothetical protein M422DRAFT_254597 [Sphaerobolus stellatus SS14]
MSHHHGPRRVWAEELFVEDIEDSEPTTGLTMGDLTNSPYPSVDPQQSPRMLPLEHPDDPHAQGYGLPTAPSRVQSPVRVDKRPRNAAQGLSSSRLAEASGTAHWGSPSPTRVASITATQGCYSRQGIEHRSESHTDPGRVSPTRGDTEEHFILPTSEVVVLRQEYSEFITLKDNAEVVLAEAMEATEWQNTVFSRVRAFMNRMSPRMKELLLVSANQASGKTLEPEEIKNTISATIKDKLHSDADSVTTVSHTISALDANAQYWSDLSNKATRHSHCALELQLKLAEEKVNNLLHEEAPEEALLETAQEVRNVCFQLDQSTRLHKAGFQQVQFSATTRRNVNSPSRNYGVNPINEAHTPQPEGNAPSVRQGTPALSISAQLDGAVVDMTSVRERP